MSDKMEEFTKEFNELMDRYEISPVDFIGNYNNKSFDINGVVTLDDKKLDFIVDVNLNLKVKNLKIFKSYDKIFISTTGQKLDIFIKNLISNKFRASHNYSLIIDLNYFKDGEYKDVK